MGLESIVDGIKQGVGNTFGNIGKAGTNYVKREFWHEVLDTLVTGAFAFAGAAYGYASGVASGLSSYLVPTFIGTAIGTIVGKIATLPFDIYYNIKSGVTAAKEALGGNQKDEKKGDSEPYRGPPATGLQPAGAH